MRECANPAAAAYCAVDNYCGSIYPYTPATNAPDLSADASTFVQVVIGSRGPFPLIAGLCYHAHVARSNLQMLQSLSTMHGTTVFGGTKTCDHMPRCQSQ